MLKGIEALCSGPRTGALIPLLSGDASLFWTGAVANATLSYGFWILVGHGGASLLPGEGTHGLLVLLALVALLCIVPTPQESILRSLWPNLRSEVQDFWDGSSDDQGNSLDETTELQHTFSGSGAAVSGEAVIPDADAANAARIAITADGSTVSYGAMHHAVHFSDSSEMPRESASEAQESCLHDPGSSSLTNEALTAVDRFNLVCFWLGALILERSLW
ncbi:hypothetical protein WJX82_000039 [Trebouxia sp. C0006]